MVTLELQKKRYGVNSILMCIIYIQTKPLGTSAYSRKLTESNLLLGLY